jgi:hypothetical protein
MVTVTVTVTVTDWVKASGPDQRRWGQSHYHRETDWDSAMVTDSVKETDWVKETAQDPRRWGQSHRLATDWDSAMETEMDWKTEMEMDLGQRRWDSSRYYHHSQEGLIRRER